MLLTTKENVGWAWLWHKGLNRKYARMANDNLMGSENFADYIGSEQSLIFSCYDSELSLEGSEFAGGHRRTETDKVLGCAPYKAKEN